MIPIAHSIAITLYIGAAALAATPIALRVRAPQSYVLALLAAGVGVHSIAIVGPWVSVGYLPAVGLGPALSLSGFLVAATLLIVELIAREVSLSIIAAPLAAIITTAANFLGVVNPPELGVHSFLLESHIALSFLGLASFATAAAAGTMYLVERSKLKSKNLSAVFRIFPPLDTLDRVNQVAALVAWVALTLGVSLAFALAINNNMLYAPKMLWAVAAWGMVTFAVVSRMLLRWSAQRSALLAGVSFAAIVALYLVVRLSSSGGGMFL
jgi:HemX protein